MLRDKITEIKTHPVSIALKQTLWTAHEELKDSSVILVEVRTDDGITGQHSCAGCSAERVAAGHGW